jgi:hypothetical protein
MKGHHCAKGEARGHHQRQGFVTCFDGVVQNLTTFEWRAKSVTDDAEPKRANSTKEFD